MKQVFKVDENGMYIEPVILQDDEEIGDYIDVPVPDGFHHPRWDGSQWVEGIDKGVLLEQSKSSKIEELERSCDNSIVGGFDYPINGVSYHFSCSLAAQSNFEGTNTLFKEGLIQSAKWTVVNNETGQTERIELNQETFNSIKLAVFQHIASNVSKLRDILEPQVNTATIQAELDAIVW
jgi:hypothetical protein